MIEGDGVIIPPGEKVLVQGESVEGRSMLIRAMAGLWPWGSGEVLFPGGAQQIFLPQRPYIPPGSLRDVVTYPGAARAPSDADITEALAKCGMAHLAGRIDEEQDWDRLFSGGEKQRIAFAHVLINMPDIVIMDEATSALEEKGHHQLLSLFHAELHDTIVFTVANRAGLEHYHSREIVLVRTQHVEALPDDVVPSRLTRWTRRLLQRNA